MTDIHTKLKRRKVQLDDEKAVKRAVSLPKSLDRKVRQLTSVTGLTYSGLVREALESYLKAKDDLEMEKAYIEYFADPKRRKESIELAKDMWAASAPAWLANE